MSYKVVILRRAQRELDAFPSSVVEFDFIEARLLSLGNDPRPTGCIKMKGPGGFWRIRAGNYRIVYEIDDTTQTVTVVKIGHRREVYR